MYGGVDYSYRISKHEVTNAQYTEFLNAVADTDTNELYNIDMDNNARGGILRSGSSGSFNYTVKLGRDDNPVVLVSFFDSMRFINWLENGQPTGAQEAGTTEDGVYAISDGVSETRAASATFFIPSEDEWYKAAYYDPNTASYFDYPTSSDMILTSEPPPGGTNSGNTRDEATDNFALTGSSTIDNSQNYLTDVGAYSQSVSPYGTYDQGGNVWESIEAVNAGNYRVFRGGSWLDRPRRGLAASSRFGHRQDGEDSDLGFRVARSIIPEPSTLLLAALAAVGLLVWRR